MAKAGPAEPVLSYATRASLPTRQSGYALASVVVSGVALLWLVLAIMGARLSLDVYKQHRIGMVASVLGLVLAIGAYWQPNRKRSMAHFAIAVAGVVLFVYVLAAPL